MTAQHRIQLMERVGVSDQHGVQAVQAIALLDIAVQLENLVKVLTTIDGTIHNKGNIIASELAARKGALS